MKKTVRIFVIIAMFFMATLMTGCSLDEYKEIDEKYTVRFVDEEGNIIKSITKLVGEQFLETEVPAFPEKVGRIGAWTIEGNEDFDYKAIQSNTIIEATYTFIKYQVVFKDYDGTVLETQMVEYSSGAVLPTDPTRTGYTFTGWDKDFSYITDDLEVTAQYNINKYEVVFKDHDGTELDKQEIEYLGSAVAPANPTREGYTFKGWDKAFDSITGDLEVVAQYEINKYTVVFKDHDGTELSKQEVEYLSDAVAPADPTRTGYTFKGWDKAFTAIKADLEVVAQYEINKYTVVFKDHDGTELSKQEVEYLSDAVAPADPTRTGYTFKGWDKAFTAISADLEVVAQYEINKYAVVFKDYDGTILSEQEVEYLSAALAPADPTRTGYTFKGWDKAFDSITENLVVTATYEIKKYTVVFKIDGKVVSSATLEYGATITAPEVQEIEEYTFSGWTPEVAETVPAHDVVYEGSYIPDIMAEHIANKMVESMETLTEQNLEAQIKAANELVSDLGGTVIWTPQNTIVSIDQNGNVTYVYPQTATEVIIEATVSYDREIDSTAYRTFTVTIYPLKSATDENTKVTVENMTNGSQLTVSEVTDTSNIVVENGEKEVLVAYDINVTENGQKVKGNYIVKLPAPENTNAPYYIYHIAEGQELELVATVNELTNGYIVFETTHFSVYAIAVDKEVEGGEQLFESGTKVIIAAVRKSGNYFLMSSDLGTSSTKRYTAVDSKSTELASIAKSAENQVWEIEYSNGNYYLKSHDGKYVTWTSGNSGNLESEGKALKITKNENGTYTISFLDGDNNTRILSLNNTTGNNYFAFYTGTQVNEVSIILSSNVSELTDKQKLESDVSNVSLPETTTDNLTLPAEGSYGTTISWVSSNEEVISNAGVVVRGEEDVEVTLTATFTLGIESEEIEYTVKVLADEQTTENPEEGGNSESTIEILATFSLGADGSASHNDGSEQKTYSQTVDGYTLKITDGSKMYTGARDAKGNSCLKFGTSSAIGSMKFIVPDDVTEVVIYVAKYKAKTSKITVNDKPYTLTNSSDNGEYDEITIDITSNKTVTFTTVSGGVRCMVNTIVFKGTKSSN